MNQLDRYIARHILIAVAFVTLIILGIELLLATLESFRALEQKSFLERFVFVALQTIPYRIYDYFPTLVFIGTLLGIGQLAAQNEFIAMQVAGVSTYRIIFSALKTALILVVFIFIWGEVVAPQAERYALNQMLEKHQLHSTVSSTGVWLKEKNAFIHIKGLADKELMGITEFEVTPDFQLKAVHNIERAHYQHKKWILHQQISTLFEHDQQTTLASKPVSERRDWINPAILEILVHEPKTMTLTELWRYIRYLKENQLNGSLYEQILWQKLLSPLTIMVMVYLAIPLLLGPLRQRKLGVRLLTGIVLGFLYLVLYQTLATSAQLYRIPPYLAVIAPSVLFLALGSFLMKKSKL